MVRSRPAGGGYGWLRHGSGGKRRAGGVSVSRAGTTWQHVPLPSGSRTHRQLTFFSPRQGVLVPEASQQAIGPVCYTTANGGLTWTAVPQGRAFTQPGAAIDFVSTQTGFAWTLGADATSGVPAMYETANSGRSWTQFTPRLPASR